ncbi:MAG: Uncharacterized protein LiPW15_691 [Parcubacteria group bacterium LiPW_15]|nr:MAG: Uncharacterized protein LiPW15_691 [Parcubacteria group bacterium LiPW_15]
MKRKIINIFGWYGVAAILGAYALLNFGMLEARSIIYQLLNLTGAMGVGVDALNDKDWQPVVLNLVWAVIAIVSLIISLSQ